MFQPAEIAVPKEVLQGVLEGIGRLCTVSRYSPSAGLGVRKEEKRVKAWWAPGRVRWECRRGLGNCRCLPNVDLRRRQMDL